MVYVIYDFITGEYDRVRELPPCSYYEIISVEDEDDEV